QVLEPEVRRREARRVDHEFLVRFAINPEQTDRCGYRRLSRTRGGFLKRLENLERALVADRAHCEDGILLQRTVLLRDLHNGSESIAAVIVPERLDHSAAVYVLPAEHKAGERLLDRGIVAVCRERAGESRPDEFALFLVERLQQPR